MTGTKKLGTFVGVFTPTILTILGVIAVLGIWNAGILQEYQQDRLTSFIDPESSESEAAYQQTQAQIAIGSGGLTRWTGAARWCRT